jgi:hypothetical protein
MPTSPDMDDLFGTHRSRAILSIDQEGIFGQLLACLIANLTHRYLSLEATGLKRRAEQLARQT